MTRSDGPIVRYAAYFAPEPGSALQRFGERWLGRAAASGRPLAPPAVPGLTAARQAEITADARLYGFHGTLKPPFVLAAERTPAGFAAAAEAFAAGCRGFLAPPLRLASIGGFLALVPAERSAALEALAADAVRALDPFRAPPEAAELARRRAAGLTARQEALLAAWGYPYVMEEFRFHLTLTCRLAEPERTAVAQGIGELLDEAILAPMPVRSIALFRQAGRGRPFRLVRRLPLGG